MSLFEPPPPVPFHDLRGRVCVVTGASSGIGLETARGLAERGATVCLVGRDRARTEQAVELLRASSGNAQVAGLLADFEHLDQVRALADELLARYGRIHVLVNNAGLWLKHARLGPSGIETTILVNHVAPFLLTRLLQDRLLESAPSRVITVSSRLHALERTVKLEEFRAERRFGGLAAYRQSKLANVLFANELSRRLAGTGVTSNSVNPGDVATSVIRDSSWLTAGQEVLGKHFLLTAEEGSRTSLHAASAPELEGVTGRYFERCAEARPSRAALDPHLAQRLWDVTEHLCGL